MLRTEVTVGGCCWSVEATIRRSLFYEGKRQILCLCAQRSHPQVLAARCSNCSTNYASDIPAATVLFTFHRQPQTYAWGFATRFRRWFDERKGDPSDRKASK